MTTPLQAAERASAAMDQLSAKGAAILAQMRTVFAAMGTVREQEEVRALESLCDSVEILSL